LYAASNEQDTQRIGGKREKTGEVDKLQLQQRAYLAEQKKAAKAAKKKK